MTSPAFSGGCCSAKWYPSWVANRADPKSATCATTHTHVYTKLQQSGTESQGMDSMLKPASPCTHGSPSHTHVCLPNPTPLTKRTLRAPDKNRHWMRCLDRANTLMIRWPPSSLTRTFADFRSRCHTWLACKYLRTCSICHNRSCTSSDASWPLQGMAHTLLTSHVTACVCLLYRAALCTAIQQAQHMQGLGSNVHLGTLVWMAATWQYVHDSHMYSSKTNVCFLADMACKRGHAQRTQRQHVYGWT